ncbi:MAG: hypothetical protein LBM18_01740 [Oscillospiraceae bacterium]|jgi:hypothetical protein|nr:hypothetical protein [Oscillospiraceae bacterium]
MITLTLVFLSGCSGSKKLEADFTAWRQDFTGKPELQITALVTSAAEAAVSEYKLVYNRSSDEETITVVEPLMIADVTAHISGEELTLSFDGLILETGASPEELSPLAALPAMIDFLESGFVKSVWTEKSEGRDLLVAELENADASRLTIWLDKADNLPVLATIRSGESVEIILNAMEIN